MAGVDSLPCNAPITPKYVSEDSKAWNSAYLSEGGQSYTPKPEDLKAKVPTDFKQPIQASLDNINFNNVHRRGTWEFLCVLEPGVAVGWKIVETEQMANEDMLHNITSNDQTANSDIKFARAFSQLLVYHVNPDEHQCLELDNQETVRRLISDALSTDSVIVQ
jgi:hypothetical protein